MLFNQNSAEARCKATLLSHKGPRGLPAELVTEDKPIVYGREDRGQKMTHSCESEDCSLLCCVQEALGQPMSCLGSSITGPLAMLLVGAKPLC